MFNSRLPRFCVMRMTRNLTIVRRLDTMQKRDLIASWPSTLTTLANQTHENGKCNNAEEIKKICGCDSYKCVRNAGFADSVCCPENFEFACCHLGQVSTTTVSTTITASTAKSAPTTTFKTTEETEPTTVSELTGNKTAGRPPLSCLLDKACTLNKQGSAKLGTRFVTNCEGISERIGLASNDKLRALGTEFLGTNGPLFLDEFVP
uniref:SMB domain-containing protein n=1 Tax=Globodera pallida TaxID=36090 RepID=A0A183CP58_GLOPA